MCEEFTCFALLRVGPFRILQMLLIQFEANKWTCLWLIIFFGHTPKFANHTHVRNVISSVGQFIDFVITFDSRFPKDFKSRTLDPNFFFKNHNKVTASFV